MNRPTNLRQILMIPGNQVCCDCNRPDPTWASMNLGITLCTDCVGIHRGLTVQISKTRSLNLDTWEPEVVKVMAELGNTISNKIYEACGHNLKSKKATKDTEKVQRQLWINAKYITKAFINKEMLDVMVNGKKEKKDHTYENWTVQKLRRRTSSSARTTAARSSGLPDFACDAEHIFFGTSLNKMCTKPNVDLDSDQESLDGTPDCDELDDDCDVELTPNNLLCRAARRHNLPLMAQAIAFGADTNFCPESKSRAIHHATLSGSIMACKFLILNGADINVVDGSQG